MEAQLHQNLMRTSGKVLQQFYTSRRSGMLEETICVHRYVVAILTAGPKVAPQVHGAIIPPSRRLWSKSNASPVADAIAEIRVTPAKAQQLELLRPREHASDGIA